MARNSPILQSHESAGAVLAPYGPEGEGIPVLQVYSGIDREYAAIRKSAAIFDLPHRAVLSVTGEDRLSFLNRMLTQELKDLSGAKPPFSLRRSFWLNRKGRIDADLNVIVRQDDILLELDAHAAPRTIAGLSSFIVADDVQILDNSEQLHRLDLHGPSAAAVLSRLAAPAPGSPPIADLAPDTGAHYRFAGEPVFIWRNDPTGEHGFALAVNTAFAADAYARLAESADDIDHHRARQDRGFDLKARAAAATDARAVRIGWHAFNIARIEAGTPLYNIDFGPTSLPHETGPETLNDRVNFKKGCYLGQEVVARMHALGQPKQRLVAIDTDAAPGPDTAQPVTGSLVFASASADQPPIGAVTSSAISPMLGGRIIAFAMVKHAHSAPGSALHLQAGPESPLRPIRVRETLRYWPLPKGSPQ